MKFVCDQMNKMLPKAFLLIKPDNIFIIPEETPLMFCKWKQRLMVLTYSHYIQFVHRIFFKTNSASLLRSLSYSIENLQQALG